MERNTLVSNLALEPAQKVSVEKKKNSAGENYTSELFRVFESQAS